MIVFWIILWIAVVAALIGIAAVIADIGKKSAHKPYGPYERFVKRGLDAFLSTGALIVLSPVLLVTAVLSRDEHSDRLPLALYGTVVRKNGSRVEIAVGDGRNDPVFMITDILPHLGKDQAKKTRDEFFAAEDLDPVL